MAVSTMIGTAAETIRFGNLVFLETQEMNLWDNLQDSKCDILHISLREICDILHISLVLRKSPFLRLTLYFFLETFLSQAPVIFHETDLHYNPAIQTFWL